MQGKRRFADCRPCTDDVQAAVDEATAEQFIESQKAGCHAWRSAADLFRHAVSELRERRCERLRITLRVFLSKPLQSLLCASKRVCRVMLGGHQFFTDLSQGTCKHGLFDRRYVRVEICGSRRRVHQPGQ